MSPNTKELAVGLKRIGRRVLPPVLFDAVRRGLGSRGLRPPFEGVFGTYAEAVTAAGGGGYQNPAIIEGTIRRTREVRAEVAANPLGLLNGTTMQTLAAVLSAFGTAPRELHVLDFGGAMGTHYYALSPVLKTRFRLKWTVCETPATARAAAAEFQTEELQFVDSLDRVSSRPDLVLCSGSLQYVEDPGEFLGRLLALSDVLIMNRTAIVARESDTVMVQNVNSDVYQARFAAWFLSEQRLLARLASSGFATRLRWTADDVVEFEGRRLPYQGLLATRAA
jgi:putative methyltransferase (TIGR04325 family)